MMSTEKYIPKNFYKTVYNFVSSQREYDPEYEYSFTLPSGKRKYNNRSLHNSDRYEQMSEIEIKNEPQKNFKISSIHYAQLDYYSVVDGVIVEDSRGLEFKISNANFIQLSRESMIRNGVIEDECIIGFGKDAKITLVKVGSSYYNEVLNYTTAQDLIFDSSTLEVGKIYILKKNVNERYMYIGKHKFKEKTETFNIPFGLNPPKIAQHLMVKVDSYGNINSTPMSVKASSISSTTDDRTCNVDVKHVIKEFKNSKNGRVLTNIELAKLSVDNVNYYLKNKSDLYLMVERADGSRVLGFRSSYSETKVEVLCNVDSNNMPVLTENQKKHFYHYQQRSEQLNNSALKFYHCKFIFEDEQSTNIS